MSQEPKYAPEPMPTALDFINEIRALSVVLEHDMPVDESDLWHRLESIDKLAQQATKALDEEVWPTLAIAYKLLWESEKSLTEIKPQPKAKVLKVEQLLANTETATTGGPVLTVAPINLAGWGAAAAPAPRKPGRPSGKSARPAGRRLGRKQKTRKG